MPITGGYSLAAVAEAVDSMSASEAGSILALPGRPRPHEDPLVAAMRQKEEEVERAKAQADELVAWTCSKQPSQLS